MNRHLDLNVSATLAASVLVVLGSVTSWATCSEPATESGPLDFGLGATHRGIDWRSSDGVERAKALAVFRMSKVESVERFVVLGPAGRRVVVTRVLNAPSGRQSMELLDDESGWWARLEVDFGLRGGSLGEMFEQGHEGACPDAPPSYFDLSTRSGFTSTGCVPCDATDPYATFANDLAERRLTGALAESIPGDLARTLDFLDSALVDGLAVGPTPKPAPPRRLRELIGILADAVSLEGSGPKATAENSDWILHVGPSLRGATLVEPELLDLASRFRGIDNTDPLADLDTDAAPLAAGSQTPARNPCAPR